jgi:thymidylate synthase
MVIMKNKTQLLNVFKKLKYNLDHNIFVIDGATKMVEVLNANMILDPTDKIIKLKGRQTPTKYVEQELKWYDSQDLSVSEIGKHAALWLKICGVDSKINSNYGHLVYSDQNHNQYENALMQLKQSKHSRRAIMIYNRPSMHGDSIENSKNDFICTLAHHFFIRDNKLHSVVNMRSNDAIYGFFNDFYWFATVQERFLQDVKKLYKEVEIGHMYYNANSFHVYEKHFDMLNLIFKKND